MGLKKRVAYSAPKTTRSAQTQNPDSAERSVPFFQLPSVIQSSLVAAGFVSINIRSLTRGSECHLPSRDHRERSTAAI